FLNHIACSASQRRFVVQVPRAAMPCPDASMLIDEPSFAQFACGVRLEIIHHSFRRRIRNNDSMNVFGTYMQSDEAPFAMGANFDDRILNGNAVGLVKFHGGLLEGFILSSLEVLIANERWLTNDVVPSIDGASIVAVQPVAVRREGNEE